MQRIAPGPRRILPALFLLAFAAAPFAFAQTPTVFVHDGSAGELRSFAFDARSGALAEVLPALELLGGATECEAGCGTLVTTADGTLFAAATGAGVELFSRGVDGRLARAFAQALDGTGAVTGLALLERPRASVLELYAADRTNGVLRHARIDRTAGSAQWTGTALPLGTSGGAASLALGGGRLYVAQPLDGAIHAFALDAASGTPTALANSPFSFAGLEAPSELRLDRRARTLVANDLRSGTYARFAIDTTSGAPLAPTLIASTASATHLFGISRNGRTLYGGGPGALEAIDLRTGTRTALAQLDTPLAGALDAKGRHLLVFAGAATRVHGLRRQAPVDPPVFADPALLTLAASGIVVLRR
ncbi:MAG: hypothetical protein JNM84_20705 [Planctomycetes bacterium]|nr:hypothetical protein [Planctomycetota bacterium]